MAVVCLRVQKLHMCMVTGSGTKHLGMDLWGAGGEGSGLAPKTVKRKSMAAFS